jgi:TRAP-type mannitol/chloroaromatic compound transport system permease large subunit
MKKELRFGFALMAIILAAVIIFMPWGEMTNGHMGLLMLALIVVAIMLGFPTAFTLMGMGVLFAWYAYESVDPTTATAQTLDLMVQRAYGVMTNDVLIAIPLFVFMGYLVERANLIKQLFQSIHLAMARVPGSLAVATLITCTVFATATGIVGAVVTLMGLLALPTMLRHGYDVRMTAGCITAGGCLGILIPPSVLLIVYGATAGVSVVQLYAGAFFPGLMLAALYIGYVIILAKLKPHLAPPLPMEERMIPLSDWAKSISQTVSSKALPGLLGAFKGRRNHGIGSGSIARHLAIVLLPAATWFGAMGLVYEGVTAAPEVQDTAGLVEMGMEEAAPVEAPAAAEPQAEGVQEPQAEGVQEPPMEALGVQEPPMAEGVQEPPAELGVQEPPQAVAEAAPAVPAPAEAALPAAEGAAEPAGGTVPAPTWYWVMLAVGSTALAVFYAIFTFTRLEIFKMLLGSFFPLSILILAVLGSIVFGLATPTEAAAVGALGGFILAALYKQLNLGVVKESVFLTAKTSAMVCWLFVGSSIFSAAFALLGGQELVENWVLSLDLTPVQFLLLSQVIIFILGWPLEWTEIIVIFMPIFIPLLAHFNIDPLFFGLLVAMNLQTAFLSPPVAMAAFYLKGVSPPHVTLNQIFAGMMPFMAIQVLAMALLYLWPQIGMWLPTVLYR